MCGYQTTSKKEKIQVYFRNVEKRRTATHLRGSQMLPLDIFTLIAVLRSPVRTAFFNTTPLSQHATHKHITHRQARQTQRNNIKQSCVLLRYR
jgi:hypothetical protein